MVPHGFPWLKVGICFPIILAPFTNQFIHRNRNSFRMLSFRKKERKKKKRKNERKNEEPFQYFRICPCGPCSLSVFPGGDLSLLFFLIFRRNPPLKVWLSGCHFLWDLIDLSLLEAPWTVPSLLSLSILLLKQIVIPPLPSFTPRLSNYITYISLISYKKENIPFSIYLF